jgi:hypothetical protein
MQYDDEIERAHRFRAELAKLTEQRQEQDAHVARLQAALGIADADLPSADDLPENLRDAFDAPAVPTTPSTQPPRSFYAIRG